MLPGIWETSCQHCWAEKSTVLPRLKKIPIVVRDKNLGEALQYIIPQKRAVILLSYFAGYNDTEVANILGVSPTSIARRKKSALLRLRELLEVRVNDE